ncbi:MAG: TerC family protein [Enterococcus sp.]
MSIDLLSKMLSIIMLNLVLSGDNAVVIALATRKLDPEQCKKAIFIGTAGAVVMRVLLMLVAIELLAIPFVKIIGSLCLLYIAYDLLKSNNDDEEEAVKSQASFAAAIRTIIIADLVMSLDNVLAIAGVADGAFSLAVFGLIISIPIVVFCSQLIIKLMDRFPFLIWVGAILIAYTAGNMIIEDPFFEHFVDHIVPNISHTHVIPFLFCLVLVGINFVASRMRRQNLA